MVTLGRFLLVNGIREYKEWLFQIIINFHRHTVIFMKINDKAAVVDPVIVVLSQRTDHSLFDPAALQRHLNLYGSFIDTEPSEMRFVCREYFDELSGHFHRIQLRLRNPRREVVIFNIVSVFHIRLSHFRLVS